jgi:hypothetical protein
MSSGFDAFHSAVDVRFRAACNEAVGADKRPLKSRVLRRLAEGEEPKTVWRDVAGRPKHHDAATAGSIPDSAQLDAFFADLAADTRWRLLVVEHCDAERRWSELWTQRFQRIKEWFLALIEKAKDPELPMPKGATAAMATFTVGATYLVTFGVEPPPRVTIPIELQAPAEHTVLAIRLEQPPTASFPIRFTVPTEPLKINVGATVEGAAAGEALTSIAEEVRLGRKALSTASGGVATVSQEMERTRALIDPDTGGIGRDLRALTESVGRLDKSAGTGVTYVTASGLDGMPAWNLVSTQAQDGQVVARVTLEEQSKSRAELSWVSAGRVVECPIELTPHAIGDVVEVALAGDECAAALPAVLSMRRDVPTRLGSLPFSVVVNRIDRRLGPNRAYVSVLRRQVADEREAVQPPQPFASPATDEIALVREP